MRRSIQMILLFAITLAASCAVDSRDTEQRELTTATEKYDLMSAAEYYGGLTYGGGVVRYRGGGSVKSCTAGPAGVLLPNRFVYCYCDQLVKDCGQDTTCTTCNNSRLVQCANTSWFSSPSYLFGSCNVSELNACAQYCQQNCSASCAME